MPARRAQARLAIGAGDPAFRLFSAAAPLTVLLFWPLAAWVPDWLPLVLLSLGVVFLGIPHGALDGLLLRNSGHWPKRHGLLGFHLSYLVLAFGVVVLWWWLPLISLAAFLLISAIHFGGDFKPAPRPWQWLAGAWLLLLPIAFHTSDVARLFVMLSGDGGAWLAETLALPVAGLAIGGLILAATLARFRPIFSIELVLLLVLASLTPPLVYFAVYFCCLHSLRHFHRSWHHTPAPGRRRLWQELIGYSLATLVLGLAAYVWLLSGASLEQRLVPLIFIGLAALTVPHMLILAWASPPPVEARQKHRY
ncbi:MAG: Brp/Blh family beta-carotene 15,15'-dioxygenase [Wenzhouxiangella sp.]